MEEKISMLIPLISVMIPVITIVLGIAIGMLAIYLSHRKRRELFAHYHQERMAAIEKGVDCPPWPDRLLAGENIAPAPRRHGPVQLFGFRALSSPCRRPS